MLVIRFFRVGKKNQPFFKIVVTDRKNAPRGGRFVEELGFWNSLKKEKVLKKERIKYWISVGAKPSDSVHNLLIREKVLEGKKIPVHKTKKEAKKEAKKEEKKETKKTEAVPVDKTTQTPEIKPKEQKTASEEKKKPVEEPKKEPVSVQPSETIAGKEKPAEAPPTPKASQSS